MFGVGAPGRREEKGVCGLRGRLPQISAEDAETWERRKNSDLGFSAYAAAQLHQYHLLNQTDQTRHGKLSMSNIEKSMEKIFFPTTNRILHAFLYFFNLKMFLLSTLC